MRPLVARALHLTVLCAFALAQPLFDVLEKTPEFFVARGSTTWDVVAFALGIVLVPPALFLVGEMVVGLVSVRAETVLHLVLVGLLSALVAMQALRRVDALGAWLALALAGVAGVGAAALYARTPGVRTFVTVLTPAPLAFLAVFLVHSPLEKLRLESTAKAVTLPVVSSRTPVVFVVFDELPVTSLEDGRHRIDAVRYPSFAALARDATWFRNATTVHEHTTAAVPAILTGELPRHGSLPLVADHPQNVFTYLGRSYAMHVSESITRLCPENVCEPVRAPFADRMRALGQDLSVVYLHLTLPHGLTTGLPSVTDTWSDFEQSHDRAAGEFERWVARIHPSSRPTLEFAHVLLPHAPWRYLPDGREYKPAAEIDGLGSDRWQRDPWLVTQGFQRHLLQLGFCDRLLGLLLRRLRTTGLYDRSLLVVVADHGVSFLPGDRRRGVTPTNIQDIAPVPLFVKLPHERAGRIDDRPAETIDVLPTIADALGTPLPWRADGASLLAKRFPRRRKVTVVQRVGPSVTASVASVIRGKYETLARKLATFGTGPESRLFAIGPHARELLGRRPDRLPSVGAGSTRVSLAGTTVRLTGTISGGRPARAGIDLALAVNGRIAAVTGTFRAGATVRFAAMAPESAFRRGRNDVVVYAVAQAGGRLALARLSGA